MSYPHKVVLRLRGALVHSSATSIKSPAKSVFLIHDGGRNYSSSPRRKSSCPNTTHHERAFTTEHWYLRTGHGVQPSTARPSALSRFSTGTYLEVHAPCRMFHRARSFPRTENDTSQNKNADLDPAGQLFNISLEMARALPDVDATVRGTVFDGQGSLVKAGQSFKKTDLITEYGLQPRDLRKLETASSGIPHIFVRPSTILVNLLSLRLLIQSDRLLVFDPEGSSDMNVHSIFVNSLPEMTSTQSAWRRGLALPYEMRALETALITVTSALEVELGIVQKPVLNILQELNKGAEVDEWIIRRLLDNSTQLSTFGQKARLVRDAIREVLDADDDLSAMYLSDKKVGKAHDEQDHQEVELLLETYEKLCDEVVEVCDKLEGDIVRTDGTMRAVLDAHRNQIMILDLEMTITTLGLASGTLVAGLYGMNLINYIEEAPWGFASLSSVAFVICALIILRGRRKLARIQRQRRIDTNRGS